MKGLAALALVAPLLAAASPVLRTSAQEPKLIPNQYIVFFKDHVSSEHAAAHHGWVQDLHLQTQGGASEEARLELRKRSQLPLVDELFEGLKHVYNLPGSLGYSGHFDASVVEEIRKHPDVEHVEQDSEVHTLSETESNAPWGLARICHRDALSFSTYNKYLYSDAAGAGVDAYVIDTGTFVAHDDFEGRAFWGKTIPSGDTDVDGNGHGTHCSGTIAGATYGVAKKAHVYAVKVLRTSGTGTMSDVIAGVEWAATQHVKKSKDKPKGFKGSVANMSLGGGASPGLDRMVNAAVDAGMHFAVAAGNDNADSCNSSPASAGKAVTVGASTVTDERAYFSNFGKCNDIFAPGLDILSTWIGSASATNVISGTSMASPHVCGLLAYLLSLQPDDDSAFATAPLTPAELKKSIVAIGTPGVLSDVPSDTANVLAWNGGGSSNWTQIVSNGSDEAAKLQEAAKKAQRPSKMELLEELIDDEFEELKAEFKDLVRATM